MLLVEKQKIDLKTSNLGFVEHDTEIMRDVIKKHEEIRERAIKYTYQLITTIGVVAGFGFTALSSVEVLFLFIFGEVLLFLAIAFGMRFIKKGFIDEASIYTDYILKLGKAIDERTKINWEDSLGSIEAEMKRISDGELGIFNNVRSCIDSNFTFEAMFYLFMGGGVFLLLSFSKLCYLSTFL